MLAELLAHEQVTETARLQGRVGFMALHGGIEEGTAELAHAAAEASNASLYTVVIGDGLWWHVPSTQFDPAHSEPLASFLAHVDVVFSLHGYGRHELGATVLLGGSNRELAQRTARHLEAAASLSIIDTIEDIPKGLQGLHQANPVNLPRAGGVQVELPPSARTGPVGRSIVKALAGTAAEFTTGG